MLWCKDTRFQYWPWEILQLCETSNLSRLCWLDRSLTHYFGGYVDKQSLEAKEPHPKTMGLEGAVDLLYPDPTF